MKEAGKFSGGNGADYVVYGKIFTSEGDQVVEAFAVKDRGDFACTRSDRCKSGCS